MPERSGRTRRPRTLRAIFEQAFAEGFAALAGPRPSVREPAHRTPPDTEEASERPAWLSRRRPGESLP